MLTSDTTIKANRANYLGWFIWTLVVLTVTCSKLNRNRAFNSIGNKMRQINFQKKSKIRFYFLSFLRTLVPRLLYINKRNKLINKIDKSKLPYLNSRVDYYLKHDTPFILPSDSVVLKDYKLKGKSAYFYDLKYVLNYFPLSY